jgi:hypothetical protein
MGSSRLYQQFLEALNPFLSHRWNESQELLLFLYEQGQPHLLEILLAMLRSGDYNTKAVVLLFAKNLVEVTENRPRMKQVFLNYFFNQFASLCVPHFASTEDYEILTDFYIKLYRLDLLRTRRAIIDSQLLPTFEPLIRKNKYILLLVVKLLRFFLQERDEGLFDYMARRNMFTFLRERFLQLQFLPHPPNNLTYSLLHGLLKDTEKTGNRAGLLFVHNIMFPT